LCFVEVTNGNKRPRKATDELVRKRTKYTNITDAHHMNISYYTFNKETYVFVSTSMVRELTDFVERSVSTSQGGSRNYFVGNSVVTGVSLTENCFRSAKKEKAVEQILQGLFKDKKKIRVRIFFRINLYKINNRISTK